MGHWGECNKLELLLTFSSIYLFLFIMLTQYIKSVYYNLINIDETTKCQ